MKIEYFTIMYFKIISESIHAHLKQSRLYDCVKCRPHVLCRKMNLLSAIVLTLILNFIHAYAEGWDKNIWTSAMELDNVPISHVNGQDAYIRYADLFPVPISITFTPFQI